jgi:hypothetical protein
MPRELAKCGTRAAYARHKRRGEAVDRACQEANAAYQREKSGRAQDREQSAPIVALPGGSVEMPAAPSGDVDARAELLANMALVKKAMEAIAEADPLKIVTLSKRHSELVEELVKVSGSRPTSGGDGVKGGDAFDGIFAGPSGRSAAAPRVQA